MCYKSGVTYVTIYAFSIENFKRSKYEVDALMEMAKIKLTQLAQHGQLLDRYGASIRILGQKELVKPDVLEAMNHAVELTAKNNKAVLNVCFPYTSRDEITTAIRDTVDEYTRPIERPLSQRSRRSPFKEERIVYAIQQQRSNQSLNGEVLPADRKVDSTYLHPPTNYIGRSPSSSTTSLSSLSQPDSADESNYQTSLSSTTTTLHSSSPPTEPKPFTPLYHSPETIDASTLTSNMFTATDPPLDLLIRTSGVSRLSDFMLWQCHEDTDIVFLDVLWPQFDLWSFLPVLWEWQWKVIKDEKKFAYEEGERRREAVKSGRLREVVKAA